jgi:hypothetical protein
MTDKDGNSWTDVLNQSGNHEAEMRYNGSTYMINDLGHPLAASWAATMFGRHPKARQVTIQFEEYEPPTMEEFRAGKRPRWRTTYAIAALRRTDASTTETALASK